MNGLSKYLKDNGIRQRTLALRSGVSPTAIHRYVLGKQFPRAKHIQKITEATDGAVTANDFLPHGDAA